MAVKQGLPGPTSITELLLATNGNFSGSLALPTANINVSVTLCVADGQGLVLYGFAQVRQGGASWRASPCMHAPGCVRLLCSC